VVLLGILNVMLMSVLERVREIGTMMALGIRKTQLRLLLVMEGGVLGFLGGTLGLLLGGGMVAWTHRTGIVFRVPGTLADTLLRPWIGVEYLILAWLLGLGGAAAGALWPAIRASRLKPVEALQAP
jgi:putative ABC transport system permease protein